MLSTLRGYKLWIYQNCDGKYLKRLTFVQRTFRLPCSSPSLTSFPGSILCFRFHSGAAAFSLRHVRTFFFKKFYPTIWWLFCVSLTVMPRVHSILRKLYGNDRIPRDPEALKSYMWAPCADYLLQDDCDFKNLYFSQKSPQCDPSALLVRENRNSGQNFNWSSIMWKRTTFIMIICLVSWGA